MKKVIIYSLTLFLVAILTISGTYAYFFGFNTSENGVSSGTHEIQVIYSGAEPIDGEIELSLDKDMGMRRELSISLAEGSPPAQANFFIYLEKIDPGLARPGIRWEFYEIQDEEEIHIRSGDFNEAQANDQIYLGNNLELDVETRKFAVYVWAYGPDVGMEAIDQELKGYIAAESEPITGNLEQTN